MWIAKLESGVRSRLANCSTLKSDIPQLVNVYWAYMKYVGKDKAGFTKEDALVHILELLDENGRFFDLTKDEYTELCVE